MASPNPVHRITRPDVQVAAPSQRVVTPDVREAHASQAHVPGHPQAGRGKVCFKKRVVPCSQEEVLCLAQRFVCFKVLNKHYMKQMIRLPGPFRAAHGEHAHGIPGLSGAGGGRHSRHAPPGHQGGSASHGVSHRLGLRWPNPLT